MSTGRRSLLYAAGVLAVLAWIAPRTACADAIEGGQVFGVFATSGTFSKTIDESYTVVRLLDFGGGSYPESITPISWPSSLAGFDPTSPDTPVALGSEFFLIGSVQGVPGQEIDHLLLSVNGADQGTPESYFTPVNEPLHTQLIDGTQNLAQTAGPVQTMSASNFWDFYGPSGESIKDQFFGLDLLGGFPFAGDQGPVVELLDGTYQFDGGSEDLFGYNPDGRGSSRRLSDYLGGFKRRSWWRDHFSLSDWLDCDDGNRHFTGAIGGSIDGPTFFRDPSGNTTPNPVPEPASLLLLGASLIVGAGVRRRRRAA